MSGVVLSGAYTGSLEYSYSGRNGTSYASTTPPTNAGDYTVTISIPSSDSNYIGSVSYNFSIEKSTITITADNKTATLNGTIPIYTYRIHGIANGETLTTEPILNCTPNMSVSGNYPINATGAVAPAGNNYNPIQYIPGTLTISAGIPQMLTFAISGPIVKVYGNEKYTNSATNSTTSGAIISYISSDTNVATVDSTTGEVTIKNTGTTSIIANVSAVAGYLSNSESYTLTVQPATITIKADSKSAYTGSSIPAYTYTVIGLVGNDTLSALPTLNCSPNMNVVGNYSITVSGGAVPTGGNYSSSISYVNATLTILARPVNPKSSSSTSSGSSSSSIA